MVQFLLRIAIFSLAGDDNLFVVLLLEKTFQVLRDESFGLLRGVNMSSLSGAL